MGETICDYGAIDRRTNSDATLTTGMILCREVDAYAQWAISTDI